MQVENFMNIFMFLLEVLLNNCTDELEKVSFKSDEANTDRPLKEFIKNKILSELTTTPTNYNYYKLIIKDNVKKMNVNLLFSTFNDTSITNVYLPDEINEKIKKVISKDRNDAVWTNPDLVIEITSGNTIKYKTIELKSTKKDSIPGSSVQQINPNEWVIFVKHTEDAIEVTTGQYIHAVNSKLQFPDRSPRPQVSYSELKNWNLSNRKLDQTTLSYILNEEDNEKYNLIND